MSVILILFVWQVYSTVSSDIQDGLDSFEQSEYSKLHVMPDNKIGQ